MHQSQHSVDVEVVVRTDKSFNQVLLSAGFHCIQRYFSKETLPRTALSCNSDILSMATFLVDLDGLDHFPKRYELSAMQIVMSG